MEIEFNKKKAFQFFKNLKIGTIFYFFSQSCFNAVLSLFQIVKYSLRGYLKNKNTKGKIYDSKHIFLYYVFYDQVLTLYLIYQI